ncbi:16S rRNA (cytosine(1402)-N(4))-methyltransferase RsmH [Cytophaga hutchinsonii]|jgi:16S rRNA (cytosine1402-N4)-methyltransferase|uniref:Ribosomal RNA small subunit methyltransferase H n=1 Tax=Cytophaga hutchinsonii (strain ATCC 33406 / DSM 1761 / CIP 103989 / NBRC 15051 / NCIMB 9469 / D465) TaxID=269798 RepID=RSMH_CYTH3|nr:16S rRNA (cytosine(1402)-N(4))-methyltransferase RsmH [Cytophaga hutchinsonii]Q11RG6.1 RecName: Full=Ribosomal RNA small subunit methyltransferase H; AltName: Full=16S rRNA m(4)C1402 methyltransferase; AltName: Full=rRNA (cytosine-N(4)-)-methyltransferase RsmH [Cytophaga hutchinsonii ATCC 33406]ABG59998.1 S-adenosylmethionine methyltransferase [Cytophaga hutchinsonii ATCC 33406]SFX25969.1 16S rRNA (cytosine1402-N4)-methyltransferase [Cytophaga hutchinsonii ATCC 33406]
MYHVPVLLKESVEGLNINPEGIYVDVTFGGGGHSREILKHLKGGKLYAFDQDADAVDNAKDLIGPNFTLIPANFRYIKKYLRLNGVDKVDGLLGDLGISSHQIDTPERGFSIRYDAPLDMRMDRAIDKTAADIINKYSEHGLHSILGMYGEVRNAKTLAQALVKERINKPINRTSELIEVLSDYAPRGKESKYYAQVFQALRIEVNEELEALKDLLEQSQQVLKSGGRLSIISYHSLEDRLVKNFVQQGKFHGDAEKDLYGNTNKPFKSVGKAIDPDDEEKERNNRARSARLRIAERE